MVVWIVFMVAVNLSAMAYRLLNEKIWLKKKKKNELEFINIRQTLIKQKLGVQILIMMNAFNNNKPKSFTFESPDDVKELNLELVPL
jgi:hypothetical protein